jgi:hypothetical protein
LLVRNTDSTLQVNKVAVISLYEAVQLPAEIKEALLYNSFARIVRANLEEHPNFKEKHGLLIFEGLIYVLVRLRERVLQIFYDGPLRGHPRTAKML